MSCSYCRRSNLNSDCCVVILRNIEYVVLDTGMALCCHSAFCSLRKVSRYHLFLGTMCRGELKLLFEGLMIPMFISLSNSVLAAVNLSGAKRRVFENGG